MLRSRRADRDRPGDLIGGRRGLDRHEAPHARAADADPVRVHTLDPRQEARHLADVAERRGAHPVLGRRHGPAGRRPAPPSRSPRRPGRSRRGSPCVTPLRGRSPSPATAEATPGARACRAAPRAPPSGSARTWSCSSHCASYSSPAAVERCPVKMARPMSATSREVDRRGLARVSAGEPCQRAPPPRGGRLRRGGGGRRVRHARLHLRRGRHPRQGARLPRRLRRPHRGLRGSVREQGRPGDGDLPALRRAGAVGRRRLGWRAPHGASRRPRPGPHLHAREQQDRGRASVCGGRRRRSPDRRLVRRDRPPRRGPGSLSGRSDPGHPRHPAHHSLLRADRRPRLEVRLRARGRPGGPGDRRGTVAPATCDWSGCTPTSARRSSSSSPTRRRSRRWPSSSTATGSAAS